jgi:hypothetical protein
MGTRINFAVSHRMSRLQLVLLSLFASVPASCTNAPGTEPPANRSTDAREASRTPAASPARAAADDAYRAGNDTKDMAVSSTPGAPYLALRRSAATAVPDALGSGRFLVRENCVIWERSGSGDQFTPLLPPGSQLVMAANGRPAALRIAGLSAEVGRTYRVSGGEVPASAAPDGALHAPVPSRCPARRFMFGRLREGP